MAAALSGDTALWLPRRIAGCQASAVICLPPAGAGAGFFRDWSDRLPGVDLLPVRLPGREGRFAEPALGDAEALGTLLADALCASGAEKVTLLGYSYGALLAFETAYLLEQRGVRVDHLIACARAVPQKAPRPSVADWPDRDLIDYVTSLGGLPAEAAAHPELMELMLPTLRADFRANDGYAAPAEKRIAADITAIIGSDDRATAAGLGAAWEYRTSGRFDLDVVDGGHFFILESPDRGFAAIANALGRAYRQSAGGERALAD